MLTSLRGARGETAELFDASRRFVESLDISRLHVFPYSERPNTRALGIEHVVSQQEKHRRTNVMIAVSEQKLADFTARFTGTTRPVLLEHPHGKKPMNGFTDNYIKVEVSADISLAGKIVPVRLGDADPSGEFVKGEIAL